MERLEISGKREASPMEKNIAKFMDEIQSTNEELKVHLQPIKIISVKEVKDGKASAVIITVPYKQNELIKKLIPALVPLLEKKLNGTHVFLVGAHRAFPKIPEHGRRFKSIRPFGRTLRSVNDNLLEDIVFPTNIVGKRIHYDLKGKQTTKVILDKLDAQRVEERLGSLSAAYNRLTGIKAVFEVSHH